MGPVDLQGLLPEPAVPLSNFTWTDVGSKMAFLEMGVVFQKVVEGIVDAQIYPGLHKDRTSDQTLRAATSPRCEASENSCTGSAFSFSLYADTRLSFCGVNGLVSLTACRIFPLCMEKQWV